MRKSSVATIVPCTVDALEARRYTCSIIVLPAMSARIFPGKRVLSYRAGMMATTDDSVNVKGSLVTEKGCTSDYTVRDSGAQAHRLTDLQAEGLTARTSVGL